MIAVTFAISHESRDLRRLLRHDMRVGEPGTWLGNLDLEEVLLVHTGIGPAAAAERTHALLETWRPRLLISAGYAGGLDPHLPRGAVRVARNYSSPEALATCDTPTATLTTQAHACESVTAKAALFRDTGAHMVDMETAAIFSAASTHGVPMLALRVISDAAGESIPVPFATTYDLVAQRPRPWSLLRWLLDHPERILPFMRFVENLAASRRRLTEALVTHIAPRKLAARQTNSPPAGVF